MFYNGSGYLGTIKLQKDGSIANITYPGHFN